MQAVLCSRYLECKSDFEGSKTAAYIKFAHRLNRALYASNRQLDALTPPEEADLSRFTREAIQELPDLPRIISNALRASFPAILLSGLPSYFLIGLLGVLVRTYRKLFIVPFLEALVRGLVLVPLGNAAAWPLLASIMPELAAWIGAALIVWLVALFLGCVSGKAAVVSFQHQGQKLDSSLEHLAPTLSLVAWRSMSLATIIVSITLCGATTYGLLAGRSAADRATLEGNQSALVNQDEPKTDAPHALVVEGERKLVEFERGFSAYFREITDAMQTCIPVSTMDNE